MTRLRWLPLALLLFAGCGDSTGPDQGTPETELDFVRFGATPPLQSLQVSFWAVAGDDREGVIRYVPDEPGEEGDEFLEFKVPGDGLLRRPNGSRFARGDSIRITITVSGDGRFLFDFQPSGLVFDPDHPARLRIRYPELEDDLDGDEDVDDDDVDLAARLKVWKQEAAGRPWFPQTTLRFDDLDEIEGVITSFTGFCIAG